MVQQKIVNHKIDIWALGIVILEILNSGKAPYEDEGLEEEEVKYKHIRQVFNTQNRLNKEFFKFNDLFIHPIYHLN